MFSSAQLRLVVFLALVAASTTCANEYDSQATKSSLGTPNDQTREAKPANSPSPNSPIRALDFQDFTYPRNPAYSGGRATFTLEKGRYGGEHHRVFGENNAVSLVATVYGDVTGDGVEEAMVVLAKQLRGSAIPYVVYVYTFEGKAKLLWAFDTGDRGDGGLRKVYGENGDLIVELYGKNTTIGDIADKEDAGACCPKSFSRSRYKWSGGQFQKKGLPEVLPNPLPNAELLIP
jgi:hypothetical protein